MDPRNRPVSEIMRREVATVTPTEKLDLTQDIMNVGRLRHIPVVDGDRLVGIISNRDLLAASLTKALDFDSASRRSFLRSVEIGEVMTRDVVTIAPNATLAEAARILVRRQIGCLPVVDPVGALIGMVTTTDLLVASLEDDQPETSRRTIDVPANTNFSEWMQKETQDLRRIRDELRVQAHLAKAEVRDRWETLERGLATLEQRVKRAARATEQPAKQLEEDVRKFARDLRDGYQRIRDAI